MIPLVADVSTTEDRGAAFGWYNGVQGLTALPASLSRAFVHEREYPVLDNEYRNGEPSKPSEGERPSK